MLLPPFNLPENIVLLITDTLPSPASFLLHKALASHLKSSTSTRRRAIVVSVSEDIAKWKAIASKSNINLSQQIASGSLTFIDALSLVQPPSPGQSSQPSLRTLFDSIVDSLSAHSVEAESPERLVILDDVSTFEWIGFSLLDVSRFVRALVAACRQVNATLILRHHLTLSDEIDDLFRRLLQISTYHLEVRSLSSGRSGVVSGEIALHAGPSTPINRVKLIPRSSALQYRLTDTGAVFFERGTGAAVL
ncbi:Elongator complex protein 6 [Leucoagaricus sp. SymC.cos]|nr:Elongator complex protein 6 [Leucoagaricus sp. SymC.cos]